MLRLILVVLMAMSALPACKSTGGKPNALSEFDEQPYRDPRRIQRVRNAFNTTRM